MPYRAFSLTEGAQIVVTDASGDYRLRGAMKVPVDQSLLDPGGIFNASYFHGPEEDAPPIGWALDEEAEDVLLRYPQRQASGSRSVEVGFTPTEEQEEWEYVGLSQRLFYSTDDLVAQVHPPQFVSLPSRPLRAVYGLEFEDGVHRLWVLFGSGTGERYLDDDHYVIYRDAPLETWSEQRINLHEIYTRLGWFPPPYERVVDNNLELVTQPVTVRWILATREQEEPEAVRARFGPLTVDMDPDAIVSRTALQVENQWNHLMALADVAVEQRNFDRADEYFIRGLQMAPQTVAATYLASANVALNDVSPDSLVIADSPVAFALKYLQTVENRRPDVAIFDWRQYMLERLNYYQGHEITGYAAQQFAARDMGSAITEAGAAREVYSVEDYGILDALFYVSPEFEVYRVRFDP